jgi:hypothetical protein
VNASEGKALLLTLGWPAAASVSLAIAVGKHPFSLPGLLLLACCTATSYALDRWMDHPKTDSDSFRNILLLSLLLVVCLGGGYCGSLRAFGISFDWFSLGRFSYLDALNP